MSDQDQQQQAPAPRTSSTSSSSDRFAAYDPTYRRFVGTHHDTAAKAKAAAKADGRDIDALEFRKV